jgi:ATP/ADP translocase
MAGQLAPVEQSAEFYGLFALANSVSAFIGPAVFGFLSTGIALALERRGWPDLPAEQTAMRWAILSILIFLVIGTALLLRVRNHKSAHAA